MSNAWDDILEDTKEGQFVPGPRLSYGGFLKALRKQGFTVSTHFDPRGRGVMRLIVSGKINGIAFKSNTVIECVPNQDYNPYLEMFWASISMGVEQTFKGNA